MNNLFVKLGIGKLTQANCLAYFGVDYYWIARDWQLDKSTMWFFIIIKNYIAKDWKIIVQF